MYFRTFTLFLMALILAFGCQRVPKQIEPTVSYSVQDKYLLSLPSPFTPLTEQERAQEWGKEILIGQAFAKQLDLYQAITAFKRAAILLPKGQTYRDLEVHYEILLCYYMGRKYQDVLYTFENSPLRHVNENFPALHDLLLILYDIYAFENRPAQKEHILELIRLYFPEEAERLEVSQALIQADLKSVTAFAEEEKYSYLQPFLEDYGQGRKSIGKAQLYNALLPGAGYLYLGQRQSATTAFLLNGLFIAASTLFFMDGNLPAGVIFASFEAGWYFGGIYGAGLEAKAYNERLYEKLATPLMARQRLFPVLRLNYAF